MSTMPALENHCSRKRREEGGVITDPIALARRRVERAALGTSESEFNRASRILSDLLEKGAYDRPSAKG